MLLYSSSVCVTKAYVKPQGGFCNSYALFHAFSRLCTLFCTWLGAYAKLKRNFNTLCLRFCTLSHHSKCIVSENQFPGQMDFELASGTGRIASFIQDCIPSQTRFCLAIACFDSLLPHEQHGVQCPCTPAFMVDCPVQISQCLEQNQAERFSFEFRHLSGASGFLRHSHSIRRYRDRSHFPLLHSDIHLGKYTLSISF